jgi:type II restriction enzyme
VVAGEKEREKRGLGFAEAQTPYRSPSQLVRVQTEGWAREWLYCPSCGNETLEQFPNNRPASDFFCPKCDEQFELKSKKGRFGAKVLDGAFKTMQARLASDEGPNLSFLSYDSSERAVRDLFVIPKQFVMPEVIEERKPLAQTARRPGWIGCNIKLSYIPRLGRIDMVRSGVALPRDLVLERWSKSLFLRAKPMDARGWLLEVMACCEAIGRLEFNLDEVYEFEPRLKARYPGNQHIREKVRQQLQVLRDSGYLDFLGRGRYRLR